MSLSHAVAPAVVQRPATSYRAPIHEASCVSLVVVPRDEARRKARIAAARIRRRQMFGLGGFLAVAAVVAFALGFHVSRKLEAAADNSWVSHVGYDIDGAMPKVPMLSMTRMTYRPCNSVARVSSGDTMTRIAHKTGTALDDLKAGNPQIENFNKIYPGDYVCFRWQSVSL